MIFNVLIEILVNIVNLILSPISLIGWGFDTALCSPLADFLKIIFYVLPIQKLLPIFTFLLTMFSFRFLISLIRTIKSLIFS